MLYVVAGFYLFQFNPSRMDPTQLNYWTACRDMSGMTNIPSPRTVACKDGNVYVLARGYGNTELIRADVDLTTFTKLAEVDLMVENRLNEMDYDPTTGLFYVTDSAHRLYSFDETGAITLIDRRRRSGPQRSDYRPRWKISKYPAALSPGQGGKDYQKSRRLF